MLLMVENGRLVLSVRHFAKEKDRAVKESLTEGNMHPHRFLSWILVWTLYWGLLEYTGSLTMRQSSKKLSSFAIGCDGDLDEAEASQ